MKILYNGGLFGREALCYQGREIIKQLSKKHSVKIDGPPVKGYWKKYYNSFKGNEDVYLLNGHVTHLPEIAKKHKKIISITVLETTLPPDWVEALNIPEVKEIWTVSEFCKELILKSGINKPVKVIYLGIDERIKKVNANLFGKDKSFKFLNVSAPHCIGLRDRKGLDLLIRAFKEEFKEDPKVTLVLKINTIYSDLYNRTLGRNFNLMTYLKQFIPKNMTASNIVVIKDYFDIKYLNELYNSVHCGVYPSRAEGFGLPQIEMMKLGKPVITSDYGATNEFSDQELRISVIRMKPLDYNVSPYYNSLFADPSVKNLRTLMRDVYIGYPIEEKRARMHSKTVLKFNWENVGRRMNENLEALK